jgi:preprotein translocase subunit SecG
MKQILLIVQIVVSLLIIFLILIQSSKGGLGSAFGAGGEFRSKRGAEQAIFKLTIALAIIFLVVSVVNLSFR